jgi:hypothetical protein
MPPKYTNDELGTIAQQQVKLWATEAHLQAGELSPDAEGWDLHLSLQSDVPLDGSSFFDSDPPRISALAQAKGTRTSRRRLPVSLFHWKHAARVPMPWFFVVVEYEIESGEQPRPVGLFVVHVDSVLVEQVAHRLRREGAKRAGKKPPNLRRMTKDLTWDDSHRVTCSGTGLRSSMLQHIGEDMAKYVDRKRAWWDDAGKATRKHRVTVTFRGPEEDHFRQASDWALGITSSIRASEMRRVEYRWGIPRSFDPVKDVELSFGKPPSTGETPLHIADASGTERADLQARIFTNMAFVPRKYWALRFATHFMEVIIRRGTPALTINFSIPADAPPCPLLDLANAARALRLLQGGCVLTWTLNRAGKPRTFSHAVKPTSAISDHADDLRSLENAWGLAHVFGLPPSIVVTPGRVLVAADEINQFFAVNNPNGVKAVVTFLDPQELSEGKRVAYLTFPHIVLGDFVLVGAMMVHGVLELVDNQLRCEAVPTFEARWTFRTRDAWRNDFPGRVRQLAEALEARGVDGIIMTPQMADAVGSADEPKSPRDRRRQPKRRTQVRKGAR